MEGLKQEILQRLGLEKEPCNPANATDVKDPEFLKEYALIKESWELGDVPKPPCASLDFDTMEVVPFRPVSVEKKKRSTRIADHVECPSKLHVLQLAAKRCIVVRFCMEDQGIMPAGLFAMQRKTTTNFCTSEN